MSKFSSVPLIFKHYLKPLAPSSGYGNETNSKSPIGCANIFAMKKIDYLINFDKVVKYVGAGDRKYVGGQHIFNSYTRFEFHVIMLHVFTHST